MTTRPTEIKIGLSPWKIFYESEEYLGGEAEQVGLTRPAEHCIYVYGLMPEQSVRTTLLHEILHAIAWTYGFHPGGKDIEEAVVSLFAAPLLTILQENDTVRAYLLPS